MSDHPRNRFGILRAKARTGIWVEALGAAALALMAYAVVTLVVDRGLRLEWPFRLVLLGGLLAVVGIQVRRRLVNPLAVDLDDDEMALAVERSAPEVQQALISAVQFERVLAANIPVPESRELMQATVEGLHQRIMGVIFERALDARRVLRFLGLMVGCVLFFGAWAGIDSGSLKLWAMRNLGLSSVEWPRYTQLQFVVEGGLVQRLPQGDPLTVRVAAGGVVPDQVFLYYEFESGETGYEPMSMTGDGEFTLTLEAVLEGVELRAEGGDGLSDTLRIEVVERPRIDELVVTVFYPEYMEKEPEEIAATEGEIRIPRGARLSLRGRSHKKILDAFLLFGEQKTLLQRDGDFAFHGEFRPVETGLLVVDVIDHDRLGVGTPPRLFLRMTDDRPPTIDFRLRGIGSLITDEALIPGDLKVKDDFGVRSVAAQVRAVVETGAEGPAEGASRDAPFEDVAVIWGDQVVPGSGRYETTASIDLKQLTNRVRPGMLLSLRFSAKDNFGPGDPHEAFGETISFRVVTRDKLIEELRRRQVEQRQELQRVLEEEKLALGELRESLNPTAADERSRQAMGRLRTLSRQETALGRRVGHIGETYQRILWEFENNRLLEPAKVRAIEAAITRPLEALAKDDFPPAARFVEQFASTGDETLRSSAEAAYESIIRRIEAVLKQMEQAETLAALLEELRAVIDMQDGAMQDVEKRLREAADQLFGPGEKPKKEEQDRDKKPNK